MTMALWSAEVIDTHLPLHQTEYERHALSSRGLIKWIIFTALSETSWSEIGFFTPVASLWLKHTVTPARLVPFPWFTLGVWSCHSLVLLHHQCQGCHSTQGQGRVVMETVLAHGPAGVGYSDPIWWAGRLTSHHQRFVTSEICYFKM